MTAETDENGKIIESRTKRPREEDSKPPRENKYNPDESDEEDLSGEPGWNEEEGKSKKICTLENKEHREHREDFSSFDYVPHGIIIIGNVGDTANVGDTGN